MSAQLVLGGSVLTMATWPVIDDSALTPVLEVSQRINDTPGLRMTEQSLPERRMSFKLGGKVSAGVRTSCASDIAILEAMGTADAPVTLILETVRGGQWVITEMAITPTQYADSGDVAQADVQLTMKKAPGAGIRIGIVRTPEKPPKKSPSSGRPVSGKKR